MKVRNEIILLLMLILIDLSLNIKMKKNKNRSFKSTLNILQLYSNCNKSKEDIFISVDNLMIKLNESLDFRTASRLLERITIDGRKTLNKCIFDFYGSLTVECTLFVSSYFSDLSYLLNSIRVRSIRYANDFYSSSTIKADMIMDECDFSY